MSYDDLKTYLRLLQEKTGFFDVRIEWSVIKPGRITAYMPGKRMGLQIADAIAGSFYYAVQPSKHGFTEERYALALKPVVYSRRERYLGYGLKFWPREVDHLLRTEEHLRWVESSYK